jgi:hypothetical protein
LFQRTRSVSSILGHPVYAPIRDQVKFDDDRAPYITLPVHRYPHPESKGFNRLLLDAQRPVGE